MTIYLDDDFKCHTSGDDTMTAVETDAFDGKCPEYIEGYRYVPAGQSWTRSDGAVFEGEMIAPWKDWKELAANVQYGGDGRRDVFVYQRRGDGIWKGVLDFTGLPNHDNWGANSVTAEYDPERSLFRVRYAQKGTEEPGVLETRGLGRFRFYPYKP